jgi:hypothetical protein
MILGTGSYLIDPEGKCFGSTGALPDSPKYYQAKLLIGNVEFCNSSAMIRKSFLKENHLSYREGYLGMQHARLPALYGIIKARIHLLPCGYSSPIPRSWRWDEYPGPQGFPDRTGADIQWHPM